MESTQIKQKSSFQLGDKKTITKFAWLPKFVGYKLIWFMHYNQNYEYKKVFTFIGDPNFETGTLLDYAYINEWVETDRTL